MTAPRPPTDPDHLLKWSIAASNQGNGSGTGENDASIQRIAGEIAAGQRPDLADPALYEALMGKSEAQMMREELGVAMDAQRDEADRVQALDNFEMLIESIDNANNITSMGMWAPLLSFLKSSSTVGLQRAALWVLGTAVQNNDKAQMAILKHDPLPPMLELLAHGEDGQVRSKAMYALSGILKHNATAVRLFSDADGWSALRGALLDPDVSLRRKAAFLVNTLLLQDDSAEETNAATTTATTTPAASRATAVAPVAPAPGDLPAAPMEQPPATHRDGVVHPAVAPLLVRSRLLGTLIVSLLPASATDALAAAEDDVLDGVETAAAGPDGDIELRDDLDYAEKASRACFTFVEKATHSSAVLDATARAQTKTLLSALEKDLLGKPLESEDGITTRWQELGWTNADVDAFKAGVAAL